MMFVRPFFIARL